MIATPLIHCLKNLRFWNRWLCWTALLAGVVLEVFLCPVCPAVALAQPTNFSDTVPAIEWLKFSVPSEQQAWFIEQDAAIWTPVLASYPGFKSKEIWTNPDRPDELVLVIHWSSFERWQAIPADVLDRTTQQFHQAMGTEYIPESVGFRLAWSSEKP